MPDKKWEDYPMEPIESAKYPIIMPRNSTIGVYGTPVLLLTYRRIEPASIPKQTKKMTRGPAWSWLPWDYW